MQNNKPANDIIKKNKAIPVLVIIIIILIYIIVCLIIVLSLVVTSISNKYILEESEKSTDVNVLYNTEDIIQSSDYVDIVAPSEIYEETTTAKIFTTQTPTELNGYNVKTFDNGDKYEGNYINGIRSGQGKYTWSNGIIYEGEFIDGEPSENGNYIYPTEATTIDEEKEYINNAISIGYDNLIRRPDDYKGKIIKVTVKITQIFDDQGILGFIYEKGYAGKQGDNEWVIKYELSKGESRIIEGDTVTFYGEFDGLQERSRAIGGSKVYIPHLTVKYHK
jgi:hypothetical protein